jgi:hypothetical protein
LCFIKLPDSGPAKNVLRKFGPLLHLPYHGTHAVCKQAAAG